MKKIYEAWKDKTSMAFRELTFIKSEKSLGAISENAVLLHTIEAATFEEAMTAHYVKLGWSPYIPQGQAEKCPNECGALFYPEGSGECPNCGKIC